MDCPILSAQAGWRASLPRSHGMPEHFQDEFINVAPGVSAKEKHPARAGVAGESPNTLAPR